MNQDHCKHAEAAQDSDAVYLLRQRDKPAIDALIWWDMFGGSACGKRIANRNAGDAPPSSLEAGVRLKLVASKMASDYWQATLRSPKARVAYWHALGRLAFPLLPRFMHKHRLTSLQSKGLHRIYSQLGRRATYVLAYSFTNWETDFDPNEVRAPSIDSLLEHYLDQSDRHWVSALYDAMKYYGEAELIDFVDRVFRG